MADKENEHVENKMPASQQASEYLEKHQIYQLFSSLMSSLAIQRPSKPIEFLIQKLTSDDPCKVCVISNNETLSKQCCAILENQFKAKIYSSHDNTSQINDDQIKTLQSETNFILHNYPHTKRQALHLLDSRIIPDRVFLISNQTIDELNQDSGDNDLIALSHVFKHNTRIICCDNAIEESNLEELLMSSYYEQRTSFNYDLSPRFPPRVLILGPPNVGKTQLALYLKRKMNIHYLNATHIMNQHIETHTIFGRAAEKIISNQQNEKYSFVGNDLVCEMISFDVFNDKDIANDGYVLDSFPRSVDQAKCLLKYNVKPNRIIVLNARDSTIIEKGEQCKYESDHIEAPGIVNERENESEITVHDLLDGFKKNIEDIKTILCNKEVTGCAVRAFDTEKISWEKILELSYDFIMQPLPKQ
eukprot:1024117_1